MYVIETPHFLPSKGHQARKWALAFMALAPFFFGALALALGQDANWDLRNYHYYNAYAFLNDRWAVDLFPAQTPSFYNPLMDLPFFWLANALPAKAVAFVLGWVQGLNFILLFLLAHAILAIPGKNARVFVSAALALLGMLGGGGIAQIGTTFGDNIVSLGVLYSTALTLRHMEKLALGEARKALPLVFAFGILPGMMMGLKLPAVIFCVGLCGAFFFLAGPFKRRFMLSFCFGLGVLLGVAVTQGYWMYFLQSHFGNPMFPYFNNFFKSPLLPEVSSRDTQFVPKNLFDAVYLPIRFALNAHCVGEIPLRDYRLPMLYLLLPVVSVWRLASKHKPDMPMSMGASASYLMAFTVITYFVWLGLFSIYRYAVTMEMVAPLLIVVTVGLMPISFGKRALIAAVALAIVSASIVPGNWTRRGEWTERFIEAKIPPLGDTKDMMVLMAGHEPYAHLIPAFPPEIKFVRIQSYLASPEQETGVNALIRARLQEHKATKGRLMLLMPTWQLSHAVDPLAYFGLKIAAGSCQTVTDRLFNDMPLSLCPIVEK